MTSKTALAASAAPRALFHAPMGALMNRGAQVAYAPDDGQGALSVADAVAALRPPEEQPAAEEAPEGEPAAEPEAEEAPEPESEPEPTGEEPLDPETAIEGETETEEPESDPATPAIAAPKSWDAEERALFLTFTPKAQAIIANREEQRDRAVSKAQQEATQARKTAEADLVGLATVKTRFDEIATRAEKVFADQWANVDWIALAQTADPATFNSLKAQHDAHLGELQTVRQAQADAEKVKQQAEHVQFQNFVQEQFVRLQEIAPPLADPKSGPALRSEITQFLRDEGFQDENIRQISAAEMRIAWEAKQFRDLKAAGKTVAARPAAPATRPAPAPARAAAPSAAPAVRATPQRNVDAAKNRLAQTGKTEDAMAVLRASRGAN